MQKPEDILGKLLLAKELRRDTHVCLPEDLTLPQQVENSPPGSLCQPFVSQGLRILFATKENNVADLRLKLSSNFWSYFEDFVSFSIKREEEVNCTEIITDELMLNTDQ